MFQRCVAAQLSKDLPRAQLYATECAEVRKMAKIVLGSEIALERAIIRLETVEQLGDIMVHMLPVVSVVRETRGKIEGVIPEVASELGVVHSMLDDTVRETGMLQLKDNDMALQDDEAKKIFEESSRFAEQQIREQFPEIPLVEQKQEPMLEAEGVTELSDPEIDEMPSRVFDYIRDHVAESGRLNLTECAKILGVQRDNVVKAVEELHRQRRIVVR